MKKIKKEKKYKEAGKIYALVSVLVIGILFSYIAMYSTVLQTSVDLGSNILDETIIDDIIDEILEPDEGYTKSWKLIKEVNLTVLATEANPGFNTSGILSVYFHPHQADIGGYMENSSTNLENNCTGAGFGYANADDVESDLKHSTAFDVVFRVQGTNDHCKVGGVFYDTNLRIRWTCADLSVGADTELLFSTGEAKATSNDTTFTYLYENFFDTNSGAGFTISQDQSIEITSIKYEAYY